MSLNELAIALNLPLKRPGARPAIAAGRTGADRPGLHIYTNAVMVAGVFLVALFGPETLRADGVSLAGLVALAIATSFFKLNLRLSNDSATMTLGYTVGFLGLITLGPHATAIAVSAGIWTQCAYRSGLTAPMDLRRRLFSVGCGVVTVEMAGRVFEVIGGQPGSAASASLAAPLAGAALVYFLMNTGLVAGAIALSTGQTVVDVWHKNFLFSAPSYFISAAIVGLGAVVVDRGAYLVALLIVAPLLLTFLAYRAYLGRIADEQEQLRIARDTKVKDVLTGLPNRAHLIEQIERSLAHHRANRTGQFAVLFLDLDGFKLVNDSLGHQTGDELLKIVARHLADSLHATDAVTGSSPSTPLGAGPSTPLGAGPSTPLAKAARPLEHTLARLGGDEFVVLLHDVSGIAEAKHVTDRLQERLARPFDLDGRPLYLSASVGIALGPATYGTPEEVLRDADTAMYRAKTAGKARAEVFDASMRAMVLSRLQLDTDLRLAVDRHEFIPYYQPVIDLTTGKLSGFEALLRWQHPERGIVEPAEFISVMEENRFVVPVGRRFFGQVCQQLAAWRAEGLADDDLSINVNFAGQQFLDPGLVDDLLRMIDEAGLEPGNFVLEITESTAIGPFSGAFEVLERARDAGLRIFLDDFGTGYSSLSCLHELPISGIKLHGSFLTRERRHPAILKAMIMLAGQLGLTVTAEGVETAVQSEQLKRLGCEMAQGYLFARPMPATEAGAFLTEPQSWQRRSDGKSKSVSLGRTKKALPVTPSNYGFIPMLNPGGQFRDGRGIGMHGRLLAAEGRLHAIRI
jgi:predicted signal transduction protein with EAL and GGDEF domain